MNEVPNPRVSRPYSNPYPPLQPRKKKSKLPIIIIGIIVVAGIIGIATQGDKEPTKVGTISESGSTNTPTAAEAETETPQFTIGDVVDLDGVKTTLLSVTESTGSDFMAPAEGNIFVLCEFDISNETSNELAISSMLSFDTYFDGYTTSISLSALAAKGDKAQLDGSISSGKKMTGVVAYEVSADWKELEITFTPDILSGDDITFVVTK